MEDEQDEEQVGDEPVILQECPTCGEVTEHDLLRAAASGWTLKCNECNIARVVPAPRKEKGTIIPIILSHGAASRSTQVEVGRESPVTIDDEMQVDGMRIRVTAVERPNGMRPTSALGKYIKTIYAVEFDTVALRYTVNHGEITKSFLEEVAPELEVQIGVVRNVQGVNLVIKTLKSDQNRTLHRGYLLARNVNRVFADLAPLGVYVGDRIKSRKRGAPKGKSKPRTRDSRPRGLGPRRK